MKKTGNIALVVLGIALFLGALYLLYIYYAVRQANKTAKAKSLATAATNAALPAGAPVQIPSTQPDQGAAASWWEVVMSPSLLLLI